MARSSAPDNLSLLRWLRHSTTKRVLLVALVALTVDVLGPQAMDLPGLWAVMHRADPAWLMAATLVQVARYVGAGLLMRLAAQASAVAVGAGGTGMRAALLSLAVVVTLGLLIALALRYADVAAAALGCLGGRLDRLLARWLPTSELSRGLPETFRQAIATMRLGQVVRWGLPLAILCASATIVGISLAWVSRPAPWASWSTPVRPC